MLITWREEVEHNDIPCQLLWPNSPSSVQQSKNRWCWCPCCWSNSSFLPMTRPVLLSSLRPVSTRPIDWLGCCNSFGHPRSLVTSRLLLLSALNQKQRSELMQRCNDKAVSVVVCSDSMSCGMDISAVGSVINYDLPSFAKTYVHRCGRRTSVMEDIPTWICSHAC